MILHGGHDGTRHLQDTHIFDFPTSTWSTLVVAPPRTLPSFSLALIPARHHRLPRVRFLAHETRTSPSSTGSRCISTAARREGESTTIHFLRQFTEFLQRDGRLPRAQTGVPPSVEANRTISCGPRQARGGEEERLLSVLWRDPAERRDHPGGQVLSRGRGVRRVLLHIWGIRRV